MKKVKAKKRINNPFARKIMNKAFVGDLYRKVEGVIISNGSGTALIKTDDNKIEEVLIKNIEL